MHNILALVHDYGLFVVFAAVLIEGIGIPVPAFATIALTASVFDRQRLWIVFLIAAGLGSIIDLAWYFAGRRLGYRLLRALCHFSLSTDTCVQRTQGLFLRLGLPSLLIARFVPGFSLVAQPLAGALGRPLSSFLLYDLTGTFAWCLVAILVGHVFASVIDRVLAYLSQFGGYGTTVLLLAFVGYGVYRWYRRRTLIRQLRMDRISVEQLRELIASGAEPVIVDVRPLQARELEGVIPGSIFVDPTMIDPLTPEVLDADELIVYCACPNEVSAAVVAQRLMMRGVKRVRPLLGGIHAWTKAGYEIDVPSRSIAG